jgi:hypothetical protein
MRYHTKLGICIEIKSNEHSLPSRANPFVVKIVAFFLAPISSAMRLPPRKSSATTCSRPAHTCVINRAESGRPIRGVKTGYSWTVTPPIGARSLSPLIPTVRDGTRARVFQQTSLSAGHGRELCSYHVWYCMHSR